MNGALIDFCFGVTANLVIFVLLQPIFDVFCLIKTYFHYNFGCFRGYNNDVNRNVYVQVYDLSRKERHRAHSSTLSFIIRYARVIFVTWRLR